ncbi:MAG: hypothetical protein R2828_10350 [Saprospiraceae bacterium]
MGLELAWGLFGLLLLSVLDFRLTTSYTSALDLRLLTFMLALPILNPDGIGIGLGFVWSFAAFRPRLSTYDQLHLRTRLTTFDFQLHAGSTNVESRWDWNWLGVCLGCCCFLSSTFDFSASCWLYQC